MLVMPVVLHTIFCSAVFSQTSESKLAKGNHFQKEFVFA